MSRLAVLIACALVAGCAAGASGNGSSSDMAAVGFDGGSSGDLGAGCAQVQITPSHGTVPVTLTAWVNESSASIPVWQLSTPAGAVTPKALDKTGLTVSFDAVLPGTYLFHLDLTGTCVSEGSVTLLAPNAATQSYRVRLTPPASSGLPQQDKIVPVYGNTPQTDADLFLDGSISFVNGALHSNVGALAGEVQLFPASGPEFDVAVGSSGGFSLPIVPDRSYQLVLIPMDPLLAPRVVGPELGALLTNAQFLVDAGEAVTGVAHDNLAAPLAGVRVALRQGKLPSGLGTSAADGSFSLRAEAGTYQIAAAADGWPEVTLDGVSVPVGGVALTLDQKLTRNAVSMRVLRADGVTPVSGAQVSIRSLPIPGAAQITAGGAPLSVPGIARARLVSASDGTLGTASLPSGTYDIFVDASDIGAGVPEGATGLRTTVSAAGAIDLLIAPHVALGGHVKDALGNPVSGARVRAAASSWTGPVRVALTDGNGAFSLQIAAGVPVDLIVDPPALAALASTRLHLGASDGALGGAVPATAELVLPSGLQIAGRVRKADASTLGGVGVDVLCLSCADPTPIAHAESDEFGRYRVAVPDPGPLSFDGGTD